MRAASFGGRIDSGSGLNLLETLNLDVALDKFTHLAILGDPGAGKTTLFEHILCVCCDATRKGANREVVGLLPIYVPLRRCASQSRTLLDQLIDPSTRLLAPDLLKTYPTGFFESYLNRGKCILLFDGLDEVLNEDEHVAAARMVETTAAIFPKCRVLVNSRLAGWRNLLGSRFARFVIRELSQREITGLINQWYLAVISEQLRVASISNKNKNGLSDARRIAYEQSEKMLAVLKAHPRLMQIASTPLILSLMCLVFYTRQDLPRKRVRLYEECITILLEEWDRREKQMQFSNMPSLEQKVTLLERIARRLFENNVSELSREEMERVLEAFLSEVELNLSASQLIRFIEERSGIISEKALGVYGFTHLTFQEFFAANGLKHTEDGLIKLVERFKQTEIEEVVLLYAGIAERGDLLIRMLLEEFETTGSLRFLLAAGKAVPETRDLALEIKANTIKALTSVFDHTEEITTLTMLQSILDDLGVHKEIIRRFGEFDISSEIGRGGMSTVYLAKERATGKAIALKIYNSGTARQLDRAQGVMSTLRNLDHPNLVQIHHLGRVNDQLFVAMEILAGQSLDFLVDKLVTGESEEDIPSYASVEYYRWVRHIFRELCAAVSYLHQNNIIHGDIKPANIVLAEGKVKLLDFGLDAVIARSRDETITARTRSDFLPGSAGYLSPERLMGHSGLSYSIDIYSLGKVLQVLWTLKLPTWEENIKSISNASHKKGAKLEVKRLRSTIDASYEILSIVEKATAYKPEERYKSVDEMWIDVDLATSIFADQVTDSV